MIHHVMQVFEAAGVGELVDRGDAPVFVRGERVPDEVAADEPGAAGDEETLERPVAGVLHAPAGGGQRAAQFQR
jgi:hypothetical protein